MVGEIFEDVHSQRLDALANYSAATMKAVRAGVHAIGTAYAEMAEIKPTHGIKQFDRFLSNRGIDVDKLRPEWARFVLGDAIRRCLRSTGPTSRRTTMPRSACTWSRVTVERPRWHGRP
jgi:hypothetical protein